MTTASLDHAPSEAQESRSRWRRALITLVIIFAAVLLLPPITVRQVESRMDPVTGSMTLKTVWLFGITSGPQLDVSPLETRLKTSGIEWMRSWQFLHNTHRNIFGRATRYECGIPPLIYELRPVLAEFAAASTDEELRQFTSLMQSGTDAEQKAAIDAAVEKGLEQLAAPDD
jgi:hypothetical protein